MFKICIYSPGKNQETWLQEALHTYEKRMTSYAEIQWYFAKDDAHLESLLAKQSAYLALDPKGLSFTSEAFSQFIMREGEKRGSRLHIVIGGAEGLTPKLRSGASSLLSLSSLTFTHQITRLILIEQLYRAFTIYHHLPYHK